MASRFHIINTYFAIFLKSQKFVFCKNWVAYGIFKSTFTTSKNKKVPSALTNPAVRQAATDAAAVALQMPFHFSFRSANKAVTLFAKHELSQTQLYAKETDVLPFILVSFPLRPAWMAKLLLSHRSGAIGTSSEIFPGTSPQCRFVKRPIILYMHQLVSLHRPYFSRGRHPFQVCWF